MTPHRFQFSGIGIHTGKPSHVMMELRDTFTSIEFHTDKGVICATPNHISTGISRATHLDNGNVTVQTVEHLLFAIRCFAPSARVQLDGPEVPIMDGSARPFTDAFSTCLLARPLSFFSVDAPFTIAHKQSLVECVPCLSTESPVYSVTLEYDDKVLPMQTFRFSPTMDDPIRDLAPARTFALENEVRHLQSSALALGGSLQNALVIGTNGPLNPEGMRFADEPARHKMLDLLGDLSLLHALPFAHLHITRPGHHINHRLCQFLASSGLTKTASGRIAPGG